MVHSPLSLLVKQISDEHPHRLIPKFYPSNGNENARILFVLEAPGPGAVLSDMVSFENNDPTAMNFKRQLAAAEIDRNDIAIWNVVPWYLGNSERTQIQPARAADVTEGCPYLAEVICLIPNLQYIVLVGSAARRAHVYLSQRTSAHILSCHHPSQRVLNTVHGASNENVAIFQFMRKNLAFAR